MAGEAWFYPPGGGERRLVQTSNAADRELVIAHRGAPQGTFRCFRHESPMYAQDRSGQVIVAHYPRLAHPGCEKLRFGMSDAHKRQRDYWGEAGQRAGYEVEAEATTSTGSIVDVAIRGAVDIGIEVQRSQQTTRQVSTRTTRTFKAGLTSLWSYEAGNWAPPQWSFRVPTISTPQLQWSSSMPKPGQARAGGLRTFTLDYCLQGYTGPGCKRACGKRHRPALQAATDVAGTGPVGSGGRKLGSSYFDSYGNTIDEVAEKMPAGELVPVRHYKSSLKQVFVVTRADALRYSEAAGRDLTWDPLAGRSSTRRDAVRGPDELTCTSETAMSESPALPFKCLCGHPAASGFGYCLAHHRWYETSPT